MRTAMLGIVAALMAGQALAQDRPAQFDLVCSGMQRDQPTGPSRGYQRHYRFDLTAKRWCSDECASAYPIETVTSDMITIRSNILEPGHKGVDVDHRISRVTGEVTDNLSSSIGGTLLYQGRKGTCEPAPFSGFPPTKF